jgi:hypothetical protein
MPGLVDLPRRRDQADVAESLGKVAEMLSSSAVDLLGQQPKVVGESRQTREQRRCAIHLSRPGQA